MEEGLIIASADVESDREWSGGGEAMGNLNSDMTSGPNLGDALDSPVPGVLGVDADPERPFIEFAPGGYDALKSGDVCDM